MLGIKAGRHAAYNSTNAGYSHDDSDEDEGGCRGTHLLTTTTQLRELLHKETKFIWAQSIGGVRS